MITVEQRKNRRGAYYKCETCGTEFYVMPADIKKAELRGSHPRFCSFKCYDKTGKNNPFYNKKHKEDSIRKMMASPTRYKFQTGDQNPNFIRFGEEYGFKGSRLLWWRNKLLKDVGKCQTCGIEDNRVLDVHHRDRNRSNNTQENLMLLCRNCHAILHYEAKDGPYWNREK